MTLAEISRQAGPKFIAADSRAAASPPTLLSNRWFDISVGWLVGWLAGSLAGLAGWLAGEGSLLLIL